MIIVSITGPTMRDALAQMRSAARHADLFELRFDMIAAPDVRRLVRSSSRPSIVTCRPEWEGGKYIGPERSRLQLLQFAVNAGARYVDVELEADVQFLRHFLDQRGGAKVIVSHHRSDARGLHVRPLFRRMRDTGADVIKLAYMAHDVADNRHACDFLALAGREGQHAVAIAMGEAGEMGRILYRRFGGWATYATADDGNVAAPGQLPADEMRHLYQAQLRPRKVFGVVGYPISQSKGVYIHNALLARLSGSSAGRTRAGVYCRFPVHDLSAFFRHIVPWLDGFSVTIPHKQTIIRFLDVLDPSAEAIGAVNTVVRKKGRLVGYNTDAAGALDAIEAVERVEGRRVLVIGAGGAARAISHEAKSRGATVLIANRTDRKARELAEEFGLEYIGIDEIDASRFDVLANATPVGMVPDVHASPVPKKILRGKTVFDAVYNPRMTKLLREAESVGARIIPGTEMYLNQAARQFKLYTGRRADLRRMRRILREHL